MCGGDGDDQNGDLQLEHAPTRAAPRMHGVCKSMSGGGAGAQGHSTRIPRTFLQGGRLSICCASSEKSAGLPGCTISCPGLASKENSTCGLATTSVSIARASGLQMANEPQTCTSTPGAGISARSDFALSVAKINARRGRTCSRRHAWPQ